MATFTNPSEIARETLRMLASRRMPPSPDNYRTLYHEIAGTSEKVSAPFPERELKSLIVSLPKETPVQQRLLRQLDQSLKNQNWEETRKALADFIVEHSADEKLAWGELIGEFLRQWETRHTGLTAARKRESVDHVLTSAATNPEVLFTRLQSLIKSWSLNSAGGDSIALIENIPAKDEDEGSASDSDKTAETGSSLQRSAELAPELSHLFAYTLESIVCSQLTDEPDLLADCRALAVAVRSASTQKSMQNLLSGIKRLAFRLELLSEDRAELRAGLLHLLQLLLENVSELLLDDRWLHGQIEMVQDIVTGPLNPRTIDDAGRRLKEVIFKQGQLKHSLNDAKEALKQMLAGFVDHLAEFADSTSDYHDKIEICAEKISKAEDISQLEDVLSEVMRETRIIQVNAQRSRDDLRAARTRVEETEKQISELQNELDKASSLIRHDQLTGTLNRRGLEETFIKEAARAQRRGTPLCIAMLDIDNFKKLNDTLGHDAGDAALIHLTTVIRETLRPQDIVARFGGEEFLTIMPDTALESANKALVRLQRELTRRFFLHNNDKLLITFSAGVTELRADDTQASVTKRADDAMYQAKQTGKNKVIAA